MYLSVNKKQVAIVKNEHTFFVGNDKIEVVVNLYEHNGVHKMTSWLNGVEELNTITYQGNVDDVKEITKAMEKLVKDNEEYILDIAS